VAEHADDVTTLLQTVVFPTTKPELIAAAADLGLPDVILDRIEALSGGRLESADEVGRALSKSRASSNPALVAITAEPCPDCGFPRRPGEAHSCIEEKARFADSANKMTDEFETLDENRE
jgi:hypothetical protein